MSETSGTLTTSSGTYKSSVAYAKANVAQSQTDSSIVTATTGKKIRVLALVLLPAASATTVTFNTKPSGSGTAISAAFACGANGPLVLPYNPHGWFETVVSEGLTVTTSSGSTVGIQVVYALV